MPELYDMENFEVDEAQDFVFDNLEDFVVDEDEASVPEMFVVEEDDQPAMVPGSEVMFVEEDERQVEEKQTDWANDKDPKQFVAYVKYKLTKIPKHSGETIPGCERAKAFLKSLDSEISKAMRMDLDGIIDETEIDTIRKQIEDMVDRLDKQIKKLKGTKKADLKVRLVSEGHCPKCDSNAPMWHDVATDTMICMSCDSSASEDGLEKTAATPVINVYVSAFERAIVGTMVNSKVSAGRNIEETYERLKNKYNFTPREELAIQQLVADYGYPVYKDRGLLNEPSDPASGDGVDWQTNYYA